MAQQNRNTIKGNFRTGDRPTQENFEDVFDSFVNLIDDGLSADEDQNVVLNGSITINSNTDAPAIPGTIRWNGTEFQYFDPSTTDFESFGSGESLWSSQSGGSDIGFDAGNVGIGNVPNFDDRFQVQLDNSNRRVRTGNTALGNGPGVALRNHAVFSHTERRGDTEYAIVQGPSGEVRINAPDGELLTMRKGGQIAAAFDVQGALGFVYVNSPVPVNNNSNFRLQVNGGAFKSDGNPEWNFLSDVRTKQNIQPFEEGLDLLQKIEPIRFEYNGKGGSAEGQEAIGISAQDLQQIFPYMVTDGEEDKFLTANTSAMRYVMINAIKELSARVHELEAELKSTRRVSDD